MAEGYFCSMEQQAAGSSAIKRITDDGGMETIGMGAVNAQLMCTPRQWEKMQARGGGTFSMDSPIVRNGAFAQCEVHHLARTVSRIGTEGKRYHAFTHNLALNDGFITLADGVLLEL